jgi:signal transduction histidine kinase
MELHAGRHVSIQRTSVPWEFFVKTAIELAEDGEVLSGHREIKCDVDRQSFFDPPRRARVSVDRDVLQISLSNVVDNAFKYSFQDTTIRIAAEVTRNRWLRIVVSNTGLPITADEVEKCGTRGWRSEKAMWTTSEGSGIGLWVTREMLNSVGGGLEVFPTSPDGITRVVLSFPIGDPQ